MTVLASYDFNGQSEGTDVEDYEPNFDKTFNTTAIGRINAAGRFYGTGAISNVVYYLNSLSPPNDCVISADIYLASMDLNNNGILLYGRMTPGVNFNCYRAAMLSVTSGSTARFNLFKFVNNTPTQIGSTFDVPGVSVGQTINMKLRMVGDAISVLVDGVTRISGTDSSLATGSAGFGNNASSSSSSSVGPQMDTWMVEDLAGGGGVPFGSRGSAFNGGRTFAGIIR